MKHSLFVIPAKAGNQKRVAREYAIYSVSKRSGNHVYQKNQVNLPAGRQVSGSKKKQEDLLVIQHMREVIPKRNS